jgi:parvulin-like peptidyl-prolyl isomerase
LKIRTRLGGAAFAALVVFLAANGCGARPAASHAVNPATKVAVVNGRVITDGDVNRRLGLFKLVQPGQATRFNSLSVRKQVVNRLVEETLLLEAADKAHVSVPTSVVDQDYGRLRQEIVDSVYAGKTAAYLKALKGLQLRDADLKAFVRSSDVITAYLNEAVPPPKVTSQEALAWYKAHGAELASPTLYHLRHILVKTKAEAETLEKDLKAGQDFATLAKRYSIDTASAKNGGDLGWEPLSVYDPTFAAAASALKVGQISGIVHTRYGYHIVELLGERPGSVPPFAAVESQIVSYLQGQERQTAVNKLIASLKAKAKLQLYPVPNA